MGLVKFWILLGVWLRGLWAGGGGGPLGLDLAWGQFLGFGWGVPFGTIEICEIFGTCENFWDLCNFFGVVIFFGFVQLFWVSEMFGNCENFWDI